MDESFQTQDETWQFCQENMLYDCLNILQERTQSVVRHVREQGQYECLRAHIRLSCGNARQYCHQLRQLTFDGVIKSFLEKAPPLVILAVYIQQPEPDS